MLHHISLSKKLASSPDLSPWALAPSQSIVPVASLVYLLLASHVQLLQAGEWFTEDRSACR